ncbi:RNA-guided endonuclease IscB [Streptomyces sp. NPDC049541]|uniref:RNA-guided endonuclease IscB n=1 Tax=Streptomyces sp. NPDC049541 TaxID=3365594 RepID=UPI0037BB46E6
MRWSGCRATAAQESPPRGSRGSVTRSLALLAGTSRPDAERSKSDQPESPREEVRQVTTFQVSEKTHQAVLPQRPALESTAADNSGSRDETGCGPSSRKRGGAGLEHGRGEMREADLRAYARHPQAAAQAGAEGVQAAGDGSDTAQQKVRSGAAYVAVLDRRGVPLMPCHPARARKLLAKGRAVVVRHTPFVIRLRDREAKESTVSGVAVRIDPGSKGTGIAVTADSNSVVGATGAERKVRRGLVSIELQHRGAQIQKAMQQRASYRRGRRARNTRYRAPRFNNRTRPEGWLAPSLQHRVDTVESMVRRLMRHLPVAEIHIERVCFDVHAMSEGKAHLEIGAYQQGTLHGYEVRQYLLEKWGRSCAYCGAQNVPLQVEHVESKARGGSDRISNLVLACGPCNQAKAARPVADFLSRKPRVLERILRQLKDPLRDAAAVNATRWRLSDRLCSTGLPVHAWSGGRTQYNRVTHGLAKSHTLDALAVGAIRSGRSIVRYPETVLVVKATGRGTYARTRPDSNGFPRLRLPRHKQCFGYSTGDLVRAVIPAGKYAGVKIGRVAVRATGRFNIRCAQGTVQGIHYRHMRLLQRADGYGYTTRKEEGVYLLDEHHRRADHPDD